MAAACWHDDHHRWPAAEFDVVFDDCAFVLARRHAAGQDLQSSTKPVAVVGAIVDKPADEIAGYTGKTPQVVFAKKLLPLE